MSSLFEFLMFGLLGLSWPLNIVRGWRSGTAKGRTLYFDVFVLCGYVFGISSKLVAGKINYVVAIYVIDFLLVIIDFAILLRNKHWDKKREGAMEK